STTVTLDAGNGAITTASAATDVAAANLTANAITGIDLDTEVTSLSAINIGVGDVAIDEADGANVLTATTASGKVTITSAIGDLNITTVSASDDAILTATAGAIVAVAGGSTSGANITLIAGTSISGTGVQDSAGTLTTQSVTGTTLNGANTVVMFNAS